MSKIIIASVAGTALAGALVSASPASAETFEIIICKEALVAAPAAAACAGAGLLIHELFVADKPFGPNGELMKIISAPVKIVDGNIEGVVRESGEVAKFLRVTIGVSIRDIERYGIFGGPNSIFRKPLG
ncbi:hypothetical protein [Chthonobacter rhizosphaerae]|uniref:hypothetical protein n=1 Tax=Chthonobacter rhizosphaerae TaxID=2735553 RepID=UPI0015EF9691|nr:hypothetical protein [Chthonobacter rhizosphaerae]